MEAFSIKTVKQSRLLRVMGVLAASSLAAAVAVPGVAWADTSAKPAIAIGSMPVGLAVDSVTDMAYTTDTLAKAISVIDLSTDRVTATINLNFDPLALAVDPTTDTVYVDGGNSVLAINGATDKVIHTIHAHLFGGGIAVDPTTDTVYVEAHNAVSAINGGTDKVIHTIAVPASVSDGGGAIAVDPSTDTVYLDGRNSMLAINGATDKVIHTIHAHLFGGGIAVDPRPPRTRGPHFGIPWRSMVAWLYLSITSRR